MTGSAAIGSGTDITSVKINNIAVTSIVSQTTSNVVVVTPANSVGSQDVAIVSTTAGLSLFQLSFAYYAPGLITSVTPSTVPASGGITVTIVSSSLVGSGTDVTAVSFGTTPAASIVSQTATNVVVVTAAGTAGIVPVTVTSQTRGNSVFYNVTVTAAGAISALTPNSGRLSGGNVVTITASTVIGSGGDITRVTLAGVTQTRGAQTQTSIVITTGAHAAGIVDLSVSSVLFGVTTLTNAFTFNPIGYITLLSPNNGRISGGNVVVIGGNGIGSGSDITSVTFNGLTATIQSQTATSVTILAPAQPAGTVAVLVRSTLFDAATLANAYTYNQVGSLLSVTPTNGPAAGGNTVTIMASTAVGNGVDITAVVVQGVAATIVGQTSLSVTVVLAASSVGWAPISVISASYDNTTATGLYKCNPPGNITRVFPANGVTTGSTIVTISSTNSLVGNGNDITAVFIGTSHVLSIVAQTTSAVVVMSPPGSVGNKTVTVISVAYGTTVRAQVFVYQTPVTLAAVTPTVGRYDGGAVVTVIATSLLGSGADVTTVLFGTTAATIISQTPSTVVVITPPSPSGISNVTVQSNTRGVMMLNSCYTFSTPATFACVPSNGSASGGFEVTVSGTRMGSGDDVTLVMFGSLPSIAILAQTTTSVTVLVPSGSGSLGVAVTSISIGASVMPDAMLYTGTLVLQAPLPPNGPAVGGNRVKIRATAGSVIGINGDVTSVLLDGVQATIITQTSTSVTVIAPARTPSTFAGTLTVVSSSLGTSLRAGAYTFNYTPNVTACIPNSLPTGYTATVTMLGTSLGSGSDITTVSIGGFSATIMAQTATTVTVLMPAQFIGMPPIALASTSTGSGGGFMTGIIVINPLGTISSITPTVGSMAGGQTVTVVAGSIVGSGSDIYAVLIGGASVTQILSQTSTSVIVITGAGVVSGPSSVMVASLSYGNASAAQLFNYLVGVIQVVTPHSGPSSGDVFVTIRGDTLGYNSDITSVTICDLPASIISASASIIIVATPAAASIMFSAAFVQCDILVFSAIVGVTNGTALYAFTAGATVTSVMPTRGPATGGQLVTISGTRLCAGASDLTDVVICGNRNHVVTTCSLTALIVRLSICNLGLGNITIASTAFGTSRVPNAYTALPPPSIRLVLSNSQPFGGFFVKREPAIIVATSDFGANDITQVTLNGIPATIVAQGTSTVTVQASAATSAAVGTGAVVVSSATFGQTVGLRFFQYYPQPVVYSWGPQVCPPYGGASITVIGANFASYNYDAVATIGMNTITSTTKVVFTCPPSAVGTRIFTIHSAMFGDTAPMSLLYANPNSIVSLSPPAGPFVGGIKVTITGSWDSPVQATYFYNDGSLVYNNLRTFPCDLADDEPATLTRVVVITPTIVALYARAILVTQQASISYTYFLLTFPSGSLSVEPNSAVGGVPVPGNFLVSGARLYMRYDSTAAFTFNGLRLYVVRELTYESHEATSLVQYVTSVQLQTQSVSTVFASAGSTGMATVTSNLLGSISAPFTVYPQPNILSVSPATLQMAGGELLTFRGTDFWTIVSVTVAGIAAPIATQIPRLDPLEYYVMSGPATRPAQGLVIVTSIAQNGQIVQTTSAPLTVTYLPALQFTGLDTLRVMESGGAATFGVYLNALPSALVTVPLTADFRQRVLFTPASLLFDDVNWQTPQLVRVTMPSDHIVTAPVISCGICIGPALSADGAFVGISATDDGLHCYNTDVAKIVVAAAAGNASSVLLQGTYQGAYVIFKPATLTLDISLATQPTTTVFVTLQQTTLGTSQAIAFSTTTLTFTSQNWNVRQQSILGAANDGIFREGMSNIAFSISSTSLDLAYMSTTAIVSGSTTARVFTGVLNIFHNDLQDAIYISTLPQTISESGELAPILVMLNYHLEDTALIVNTTIADSTIAHLMPQVVLLTDDDYRHPVAVVITPYDDDIARGDVSTTVTLSVFSNNSLVTVLVPVTRLDNDTADFEFSDSRLTVNETGSQAVLFITLLSQPQAPITLRADSNNVQEVTVSWTTITVTPSQWRQSISLTVTGVMDLIHDNGSAVITVSVQSAGDANYNGRSHNMTVDNTDIYFPRASRVAPTVFPYSSFDTTITCVDCLPGVQGYVNGATLFNVRYDSTLRVIYAVTPEQNITGMLNLTLINPDGGRTDSPQMYYTDSCPYEGRYGMNGQCHPCPAGASCPGGARMQALPGYWTQNENSLHVEACPLGDVCTGGVEGCAAGYTGRLCTDCAVNYYHSGNACFICDDPARQALLLAAQFAFVMLVFVVVFVAGEATRDNVMFLLGCLRTIWVVSTNQAIGLPSVVVSVYGVLNLFAGDLNFVRPGCSGLNTFAQLYAVNVGVLIGLILPLMLLHVLRFAYVYWRQLRFIKDTAEGTVVRADVYSRAAVSIYALVMFEYQVLIVKGFQTFNCVNVVTSTGDVLSVMVADTNQTCFAGVHVPIFLFSLVLIPALMAVPMISLRLAHKEVTHVRIGPIGKAIALKAIDELKTSWFWYEIAANLSVEIILAAASVFCDNVTQAVISMGVLLLVTFVVSLGRPYRDWYKNGGMILTCLIGFLTQTASLMLEYAQYKAALLFSYSMLVCLLIYVAGLVCVLVYYVIYRRLKPTTTMNMRMVNLGQLDELIARTEDKHRDGLTGALDDPTVKMLDRARALQMSALNSSSNLGAQDSSQDLLQLQDRNQRASHAESDDENDEVDPLTAREDAYAAQTLLHAAATNEM
eukprot:TRINITY_DN4765_c0_g1_i8.p1 TRINITY_DN4765_c0_g1~~TRINITY_DN4765_c0_g1_i8.p1  ORF type:complete len:2726 (-),score=573.81 TRINITY_DN4765_c0_g1_i8:194-8371(-)